MLIGILLTLLVVVIAYRLSFKQYSSMLQAMRVTI